jgi:K+/H+ antiporter YhaU regulatory subunit KhtT
MIPASHRRLLVIAFLAVSGGLYGADAPASPAAKAKMQAPSAADMKKLVQELNVQRDSMISEHEALAKKLKDATAEQRQAILDKMAEQKKAFEEATSALHKQIRDEQRRQRQNAGPGKR